MLSQSQHDVLLVMLLHRLGGNPGPAEVELALGSADLAAFDTHLTRGTSSAGRRQLSRLAGEVGLSTTDYDVKDLASQAIRYGKLGDALVTVLDHSGDDAGLRHGTAQMFRDLGEAKQ